jgi:hypothetical protein
LTFTRELKVRKGVLKNRHCSEKCQVRQLLAARAMRGIDGAAGVVSEKYYSADEQ